MGFASTLAALRAQGLRLDRITPADDPAEVVMGLTDGLGADVEVAVSVSPPWSST